MYLWSFHLRLWVLFLDATCQANLTILISSTILHDVCKWGGQFYLWLRFWCADCIGFISLRPSAFLGEQVNLWSSMGDQSGMKWNLYGWHFPRVGTGGIILFKKVTGDTMGKSCICGMWLGGGNIFLYLCQIIRIINNIHLPSFVNTQFSCTLGLMSHLRRTNKSAYNFLPTPKTVCV